MRSSPLLILLLLALVPLAAGRAAAQHPIPPDPRVVVGTLDNGLTYYIRENREPPNRAELRLAVNVGSVLEDDDQRGLAHFLEHMAFNGTRHFAPAELVDYLEGIGMRFGPDVNAYTSFDETVYMLTVPTDSAGVLETGLQILEDWAWGISLDSLEIERERGVVIEEWRLGQGAASRLREQQFPVLAHGSRYAERQPIGTRESLETFDPEALRRFYRDWYRPDLMAVVAVGDFDADSMEQRIRDQFGRIPAPADARPRREFGMPRHRETRLSVATDPEQTRADVRLYLKRPPQNQTTRESYREWMVESLASGMLISRLNEMLQRPDAPFLDVSSFRGRFLRSVTAYQVGVRTAEDEIVPGLEALLREFRRAALHGFTSTELEREKRETLRNMEQRYLERAKETSASYAGRYASHFLYGGALADIETEWALYQELIPGIELDEVGAVARRWTTQGDRVVLVTAPRRDSLAVPTERELRRALARVGRERPEPYADRVSDAPLVAQPPTPGPVVEERRVEEIGLTEWTLANGVRVLIRPTPFREDQVLLAARSPGGHSLVADSLYIPALTASAVVQAGGAGALSSTELRKRLAGRTVGVGAEIGSYHEGLSGAASPGDLEALLQLIYLKFTAPRRDSAAFQVYRDQARASLANRTASPEIAFADTLRATLTQDHPRARPPSVEMFDRLDLDQSFRIYRDRFADASDFTFYLVGNVEPERLRPLVERYLGGLPSTGRQEQARDLGIRPPDGVVRKVVRRGSEDRAQTQLVFHGPFAFDRDNLASLRALADVLRLRLRERLREDLGGTYGVSVRAGGGRDPRPEFQLAIGFGGEPARMDELTAEVFATLDSLKASGPTPDELAKVHEMQVRERETELRDNHFWLSQLLTYDRYGWDPREIPGYRERILEVDAVRVRTAAQRYLPTDRYVQVTLLPEPATAPETGTELPS